MSIVRSLLKDVGIGLGLGSCAVLLHLIDGPFWMVAAFGASAFVLTAANAFLSCLVHRKTRRGIVGLDWHGIRSMSSVILFDKEPLDTIQIIAESSTYMADECLRAAADYFLEGRDAQDINDLTQAQLDQLMRFVAEKYSVLVVTPWSYSERQLTEASEYDVVPSCARAPEGEEPIPRHASLVNLTKALSVFMKRSRISFRFVAVHRGHLISPTKMSLLGNSCFWIDHDTVLLHDIPLTPSIARNILSAVQQYPFQTYSLVAQRQGFFQRNSHIGIVTSMEAYMTEGLLDFGETMLGSPNTLKSLLSSMSRNAKAHGWKVGTIAI